MEEGDSRRRKAAWTGAKTGMVLGLAFGQSVIASNSPLGFYTGNVGLVLGGWILAGAAAGAVIGWAISGEP